MPNLHQHPSARAADGARRRASHAAFQKDEALGKRFERVAGFNGARLEWLALQIKEADMNVRRMKLALLAAISTSLLIVSAAAQQPSQDTMRKAFAEADDNKDGLLNIDEYIGHVIYVFRQVDTNRDGFITEQEVMVVFTTAYRPQLFKAADRNGDGIVSVGVAVAAKVSISKSTPTTMVSRSRSRLRARTSSGKK
jgi:Ca2+-binding EF-hand superfamily protein